jgi:hypothetical protein
MAAVYMTVTLKEGDVMANIDLDAGKRIVGLEVLSVHEFNLSSLIEIAGLGEYFSQDVINRARYVRTNTAPVIEPVSEGIPETTV